MVEAKRNGEVVFHVPDQSGNHLNGAVDLDLDLSPHNKVNLLKLKTNLLPTGREGNSTRTIQLNRKGWGSVMLGRNDKLEVQLDNPNLVKKPVKPRKPRSYRLWGSW